MKDGIKYSKKRKKEVIDSLREYIDSHPVPIFAEFAYQVDIPRSTLYEWEELKHLREMCLTKKEAALERGALTGSLQPTMAIFSLKQLGWKDEKHQTIDADINNPLKGLTTEELKALIKK